MFDYKMSKTEKELNPDVIDVFETDPVEDDDAILEGMYAVIDYAAEIFESPMLFLSPAQAIRAFRSSVRPGTLFYDYPEDYALVHLGDFDKKNGKFYRSHQLISVITAEEAKELMINDSEVQESGAENES